MGERKPEFWVVKKTVDGKEFWRTYIGPTEFCPCRSGRARYFSMTEAARQAESHPGSKPIPVYCTTRKVEPKMRERSTAWVLRRLAEGKIIYFAKEGGAAAGFMRFRPEGCLIEWHTEGDTYYWAASGWRTTNGRMLCRVARSEEVPA